MAVMGMAPDGRTQFRGSAHAPPINQAISGKSWLLAPGASSFQSFVHHISSGQLAPCDKIRYTQRKLRNLATTVSSVTGIILLLQTNVAHHGQSLYRRRYAQSFHHLAPAGTNRGPELMTIHNDFHHAQYQKVIDFDTSSLSAESSLPARVLQLRAQIASGQAEEVLADVEGEDEVPELAAVKVLAQYSAGNTSGAVKEAESLAASSSENPIVQLLVGTVLQAAGKSEEALALLSKHSGSLEAYVAIALSRAGGQRLPIAYIKFTDLG